MSSNNRMFQLQDRSRTEEVYEHYNIIVDPGQQPMRIDKFLMGRIVNVSRNIIQSAVQNGNVLVNGSPVKNNYKIKPKDEIKINFSTPPREVEIIPQDIPINIVYEDDDIIVVNKEAGIVVHPGYNNYDGTLLNALCYHLSKDDLSNPIVPYLVHRIDKDTSGILLVSKKERTQTLLAKQFFHHTIERKYIALVWGNFEENSGTIDVNVGRSAKDRRVMTIFPEGDYGKHAVTHYKVLERFGYVSVIECQLETGRTHQIRTHMKSIGHPLFNDATYGGNSIIKGTTFSKYKQFVENCFKLIPRQALHAKSLGFTHPITKEYMFFESELPEDLNAVIEKWRLYSANQKL